MTAQTVYVRKDGITDIEDEALDGLEGAPEDAGRYELQLQFVEYRARGWSYTRIAKRLRVSKGTLANWSSELEEEIASLKAMELEALHESFFILKEGRIRLLGEQVKKMRQELKKRDFSDVPTDKLLELLLKYEAALQEEDYLPKPMSEDEIAELKALKEMSL